MSFYQWLLKFEDVDLPIGKVAKQIKHDDEFPRESSNPNEIGTYLMSQVSDPMYESAMRALDYYKKENIEN